MLIVEPNVMTVGRGNARYVRIVLRARRDDEHPLKALLREMPSDMAFPAPTPGLVVPLSGESDKSPPYIPKEQLS